MGPSLSGWNVMGSLLCGDFGLLQQHRQRCPLHPLPYSMAPFFSELKIKLAMSKLLVLFRSSV